MDSEALIDLYIQDTYTTRNGKERKMKGQVREYLGNNKFHLLFLFSQLLNDTFMISLSGRSLGIMRCLQRCICWRIIIII